MSPLSNSYLTAEELLEMEQFYPLRALICERCFLVQVKAYETPERIFSEYAYFSSYSATWLEHARAFAQTAIQRFGLHQSSTVVEIASNDGYLLQYFAQRGIRVLGVEPAANVAAAARAKGINTVAEFFGRSTAQKLAPQFEADLLIGNNVIAHVPDPNDFLAGFATLLNPDGIISVEFPHLLRLIEQTQFDTIYHEHFSYFSFSTAQKAFARHALTVFDVEEIPTHGGSLRVYARHNADDTKPVSERVVEMCRREHEAGLLDLEVYSSFDHRARKAKRDILRFLIGCKENGKAVVGYGAPAKGNTLLNYCGIRTDFIDYTVDLNPNKQGHFLPGSHIPIKAPDEIGKTKPDLVFILPWNLKDEIVRQMSYIREWSGRFVVSTPELLVLP
jgi:SAM-dependent methyltransferase